MKTSLQIQKEIQVVQNQIALAPKAIDRHQQTLTRMQAELADKEQFLQLLVEAEASGTASGPLTSADLAEKVVSIRAQIARQEDVVARAKNTPQVLADKLAEHQQMLTLQKAREDREAASAAAKANKQPAVPAKADAPAA